ncbi:unnamed protein product [Merluccius merluccius]
MQHSSHTENPSNDSMAARNATSYGDNSRVCSQKDPWGIRLETPTTDDHSGVSMETPGDTDPDEAVLGMWMKL